MIIEVYSLYNIYICSPKQISLLHIHLHLVYPIQFTHRDYFQQNFRSKHVCFNVLKQVPQTQEKTDK